MCMSSGSSKAPPPTPPTRFEYLPSGQTSVQRQAADMKAKGYTNTAGYGASELGSGGPPVGQLSGSTVESK